jgi:phospholipase C
MRIAVFFAVIIAHSGVVQCSPLDALNGRIKHVIVLMEENRSFDHFFGWAGELLGVNGLKGDEFNYFDTSDPSKGSFVVDSNVGMINDCDPQHGTPATTLKIFGAEAVAAGDLRHANMSGFIEQEASNEDKNFCDVMSMMTPDRIPVITSLAQVWCRWGSNGSL